MSVGEATLDFFAAVKGENAKEEMDTGFITCNTIKTKNTDPSGIVGTCYQKARLIARKSPHGNYALRCQTEVYDDKGGGTSLYPFNMSARIKDWWNGYSDYTLKKEDVAKRFSQFKDDLSI